MTDRKHSGWGVGTAIGLAVLVLIVPPSCGPDAAEPAMAPTVSTLPEPRPVAPAARLDSVTTSAPGFVTVTGTVTAPHPDTSAILELSVDGVTTVISTADGPRLDDDNDPRHSVVEFGLDAPAPAGDHEVCVSVVDPSTSSNAPIGCETVRVIAPDVGDRFTRLTAITPRPGGSTVEVRGVVEPGFGTTPAVMPIEFTPTGGDTLRIEADIEQKTFRVEIPDLADGTYSICAVDPVDDSDPACGSLAVGDLTVAVTGSPARTTAVEPESGHPLAAARRDAGVSVELSDDSVMWFFGDTSQRDSDGALVYFVNNTAAWATDTDPAVTLDAAADNGEPIEFITPSEDFCRTHEYPKPVYWPESAVSVPQPDGTDRISLFVSKICVGTGYFSYEGVGMAVVEVIYDPRDPPAGRQLIGKVVAPDVATVAEPYGRASLVGPDGLVYLYHCGSLIDSHETCATARVPADSISDGSSWRYWNGGEWTDPGSWSADSSAAAPLALPGNDGVPIAAFTTDYDDDIDAFVMVYSPAPVYCERIAVRLATGPVGPWTPSVEVVLPGCNDQIGDDAFACYAATAQPAFNQPGELGLGYFDQFVADSSGNSEYYACTVRLTVAPRTSG